MPLAFPSAILQGHCADTVGLVQTLVVVWIIVGLLACVGALRDVYALPHFQSFLDVQILVPVPVPVSLLYFPTRLPNSACTLHRVDAAKPRSI